MPSLHDYQRTMAAYLLAVEADARGDANADSAADAADRCAALARSIMPWCTGSADEGAARLAIYRNTALGTLGNALGLTFPAVRRVVGAEFFELAARCYLGTQPPRSAYLNDYGADLPSFLSSFGPAAGLPYLADLARLEWAVSRALHAADVPPLDAARLAALAQAAGDPLRAAQLRFVPHPSVSQLRLDYPADAIWEAVLEQDDAGMAAIDLANGPVWLMIERDATELVQIRRLAPGPWRLTERLLAGEPLQVALEAVGLEQDGASVALRLDAVLADHLASGRFVDFQGDAAPLPDGPATEDTL